MDRLSRVIGIATPEEGLAGAALVLGLAAVAAALVMMFVGH